MKQDSSYLLCLAVISSNSASVEFFDLTKMLEYSLQKNLSVSKTNLIWFVPVMSPYLSFFVPEIMTSSLTIAKHIAILAYILKNQFGV